MILTLKNTSSTVFPVHLVIFFRFYDPRFLKIRFYKNESNNFVVFHKLFDENMWITPVEILLEPIKRRMRFSWSCWHGMFVIDVAASIISDLSLGRQWIYLCPDVCLQLFAQTWWTLSASSSRVWRQHDLLLSVICQPGDEAGARMRDSETWPIQPSFSQSLPWCSLIF